MLFKHSFYTVVNIGIRYTGYINCKFDIIYIKFALYNICKLTQSHVYNTFCRSAYPFF
jgi:hypothetical protein